MEQVAERSRPLPFAWWEQTDKNYVAKIYPSILDSFQRYLDSEKEEALQELIDKINRVPFESEAADKGTAFNELVDSSKLALKEHLLSDDQLECDGFSFRSDIVAEFAEKFKDAAAQVYVEGELQTNRGLVLLYGYADEVFAYKGFDIKTTGNYTFPKYINNWQHVVYPFCLRQKSVNVESFEYSITDFNNVYTEEYVYNPAKDEQRLKSIVEQFLDFLFAKRELITDKKIFGCE